MLSVSAQAFAQTSQASPATEEKRFKQFESAESPNSENLPPILLQVARFTGALPIMRDIEALQNELKQSNLSVSDPLTTLAKRQKLVYLREKLNNVLERAMS